MSVFKYVYVYGRWRYVRQLLTALAWSSVSWAYRTSNTENSYSVWQVFLYCSILCQEVPSQFLWSHTYLQRVLASKLKRSCEFTVKKKETCVCHPFPGISHFQKIGFSCLSFCRHEVYKNLRNNNNYYCY